MTRPCKRLTPAQIGRIRDRAVAIKELGTSQQAMSRARWEWRTLRSALGTREQLAAELQCNVHAIDYWTEKSARVTEAKQP